MIFLGLILLGAGHFAHLTFLWVLGGIITAGAGLHAMGAFNMARTATTTPARRPTVLTRS